MRCAECRLKHTKRGKKPLILRWVRTRRSTLRPVSSSSPLSTVLAALTAHGSAPLVPLHGDSMKHRLPFRWPSQDVASVLDPISPTGTREHLVHSLRVRWVLCSPSTLCTPYSQRLEAFAFSPYPGVRGFPTLRLLCPIRLLSRASGFRMGLPTPTVHSPSHSLRSLPCSLVGLTQDAVGGVWSMASSALCGSPGVTQGRTGVPVSPRQSEMATVSWLSSQRYVAGFL